MAISEFEEKRCVREVEKFMEAKRPPPQIRNQIDFGYRIDNQSVELFEIRPKRDDQEGRMEIPFAKATYVKKEKHWKIYWQRQDLKWHVYKPVPEVAFFEEFLQVVADDEHACFFG